MVQLSYCLVTLLVFETIQGQAHSDGQINVTTTSAITTSNDVNVSRNGNVESQVTSQETETTSHEDEADDLDARLERSQIARMIWIRQHVLDSLGWEHPPSIDPETKRRLLMSMQRPVYVTKQKHCYYPACDLPVVDFPEYMNRSIWFDRTSRNIRYFFNIPAVTDTNFDVNSAVVRLHLKRREECLCAYDGDPSTSRLHIKIYQYRKPIRSHSRLRHSNMRLIDAKMVTWDSARWVSLHVTDVVRRIMTRGRRNGGFEVHVRDMEEHVLDAKTVIDPTVCSSITDYECTYQQSPLDPDFEEPDDPNYSPILEVTSTTTNRIEKSFLRSSAFRR